jgi:hypothetical protein
MVCPETPETCTVLTTTSSFSSTTSSVISEPRFVRDIQVTQHPQLLQQQQLVQQRGLRPPVFQHASRSCGDPCLQVPTMHDVQPRSASYGGERPHSPVDPRTKAQLTEFEEIIEQMDKYWPRRRVPPPPYPQRTPPTIQISVQTSPRVPPPTGIDEDLRMILNNIDPELLASSAPSGVKIESTPLPPSPNG